jgi:hypothetical protein
LTWREVCVTTSGVGDVQSTLYLSLLGTNGRGR